LAQVQLNVSGSRVSHDGFCEENPIIVLDTSCLRLGGHFELLQLQQLWCTR